MYRYLLTLLPLLASVNLFAQLGEGFGLGFQKIKLAKETQLREALDLSNEEAAAFFPLYWEYEVRLRRMKRDHREAEEDQILLGNNGEGTARKLMEERHQAREEQLRLRTEADLAFLKVLPASKVLQLDAAERSFQRKLVYNIRGRGKRNR